MQTHEIGLWIFNAPTRKGIDEDVCLIPRRDGDRSAVPFQKALVETVHVLHEWHLEMQARLGDRVADRLSKLRDDHLLGLVNRIKRAGENEEHDKDDGDNRCQKVTLLSLPALPGFGRERQDRKQLPQGLVDDDFLPGLRQDLTHGFEVKPGAGDFWRFDILLKQALKAATSPSASLTRLKR